LGKTNRIEAARFVPSLDDEIEGALNEAELPEFCWNLKLSTSFICPTAYP